MKRYAFRRYAAFFVVCMVLDIVLAGCASKSKSIPDISTLALLSQNSELYISVPVKYHKDLVAEIVASQTGLSASTASTVTGRMSNLYVGLGGPGDSGRIEIAADGSFPSFAVDIALSEGNGWTKKKYESESQEALAKKYPRDFKYYLNRAMVYKISFPTNKEMLVAKKITPLLDNYASRYDVESLPYNEYVNLDGTDEKDILFYSPDPGTFAAAFIGEIASGWFTLARGKFSRLPGNDYLLDCFLSLADKNRKTIVLTLLNLGGIPVEEVDSTTIRLSGFKVSRAQIKNIVSSGL